MPNIIKVKIDVKKLDKSRFFQGKEDRNGHAPLYADLVLIPRKEPGKYGDTHMVKQDKRKTETLELPIIGSATEKESLNKTDNRQRPYGDSSEINPTYGVTTEDEPF